MPNLEAVIKKIVDNVFPPLNLEWDDHWQEIQYSELCRKNLGFLLQIGFESQPKEIQKQLIENFYKILFPHNGS